MSKKSKKKNKKDHKKKANVEERYLSFGNEDICIEEGTMLTVIKQNIINLENWGERKNGKDVITKRKHMQRKDI